MADNKVFNKDSIEGFGGLKPKNQSSAKNGALNSQKPTNPKK